jgi:hypothetical protein
MNTNDWIEKVLRDDARQELPDGGFTRRVMGAMPPARSRGHALFKPALIMGSAALGGAIAALFAGASIPQGFVDIVQMRGFTTAAMTGLGMGLAMVVSAVVLATDD